MGALRPSFPGFPRPPASEDPTLAVVRFTANQNNATGIYATITANATTKLDGFTYDAATGILTCLAPGIYEFIYDLTRGTTAAGGDSIGYRVNGGADVEFDSILAASGGIVHAKGQFRTTLAYGDKFELRYKSLATGTIYGSGYLSTYSFKRVSRFQ